MSKILLSRRQERGQGLVELALTMPMLVVVLAGLIHFGLVMQTQQVITNASRAGARRACMPQGDAGAVQTAVLNYCQNAGLSTSKVTVNTDLNTTTSRATVTVTYQFSSPVQGMLDAAAKLLKTSVVTPKQLQATTVMRM
jgi:Flp pilus assembly protein TadG